jgi:hypothetical protein
MITTVQLADLSAPLQEKVLSELRRALSKEDRWLSYREAAWLYGYTYQTIRHHVCHGKLRPKYRAGQPMLRHSDMRRMIARKKVAGSPRRALKNAQTTLA